MKEKIVTIMLMIVGASVLLSAVSAQPPQPPSNVEVVAYTKDTQYRPGEEGTLYIAVLNYKDDPVEIKNITIYYPWYSYVKDVGWTGNDTVIPLSDEKTLSSNGGKFEKEVVFKVPNDGRILSAFPFPTTSVIVYDNDGNFLEGASIDINIAVPTSHGTIQDIDKMTTLFTIQVILLIVCTIIVAATIFLSARKPPVLLGREERPE